MSLTHFGRPKGGLGRPRTPSRPPPVSPWSPLAFRVHPTIFGSVQWTLQKFPHGENTHKTSGFLRFCVRPGTQNAPPQTPLNLPLPPPGPPEAPLKITATPPGTRLGLPDGRKPPLGHIWATHFRSGFAKQDIASHGDHSIFFWGLAIFH